MGGCNDYDYINKPKPDIEFLYKLARQVEALEFEIGLAKTARDGAVARIKQYEEITSIQVSELPKIGGNLDKFKQLIKGEEK